MKTRYIPFDLRGEYIVFLSDEDMTGLFGPATTIGGQSRFDLTVGQYQHVYRVTNSKSEVFEIPAAYSNINNVRKIVGINGNLTIELSFTITDGVYINAAITKRETSIPGISYEEEQDLTAAQRRTAQQNIGLEKDVAGGVAGLDESGKIEATQMPTTVVQTENGKVPASVLPAYVDDVIEGYYGSPTVPDFSPSSSYSAGDNAGYNGKIYRFTEAHTGAWNPNDVEEVEPFPVTGETGKVYSDIVANTTYRWSGSTYTQIKGDLSLGETSETAFAGNRGKALEQQMPGKQDVIQDLSTIRNNALYGPTSVQFGAAQQLTPTQQVNAQNNMMGKAYAPAQNSGLGKVYLDKNNGVLTQAMIPIATQENEEDPGRNTVYVIQYDYTMTSDITIPAGCTLEFDGGSISGSYTLTGDNTRIIASDVAIFSGLTIAGTWNCPNITSVWFSDLTGSGNVDRIRQVFNLQNSSINNTIYVAAGSYYVNITSQYEMPIRLNNSTLTLDGTITVYNSHNIDGFEVVEVGNNSKLNGKGKITGDSSPSVREHCFGVIIDGNYSEVEDIEISGFDGDGIYITGATHFRVTGVNCHNNKRQGMSVIGGEDGYISYCTIQNIGNYEPSAGIDIEPNSTTEVCSNITINNNIFDNCKYGVSIIANHNDISDIHIVNNKIHDSGDFITMSYSIYMEKNQHIIDRVNVIGNYMERQMASRSNNSDIKDNFIEHGTKSTGGAYTIIGDYNNVANNVVRGDLTRYGVDILVLGSYNTVKGNKTESDSLSTRLYHIKLESSATKNIVTNNILIPTLSGQDGSFTRKNIQDEGTGNIVTETNI